MQRSAFFEFIFYALVFFSVLFPIATYFYMLFKKSMSQKSVLLFGLLLIIVAGIDIVILQRLKVMAEHSTSLTDDFFFASEISAALYLLPALFAGVGVNVISSVLVEHIADARMRFDREHIRNKNETL